MNAFFVRKIAAWHIALCIVFVGVAITFVVIDRVERKETISLEDLKKEEPFWQQIFKKNDEGQKVEFASHSLLSGSPLPIGLRQPYVGVIVDNAPKAREQHTGLSAASLVIEAPVEGGSTRLLAVYDGQPVSFVGPVRSVRPYFVELMAGLGGALAHVGGSPEGLALLNDVPLKRVEENGVDIVRDSRYAPPHNAFANVQLLYAQTAQNAWPVKLTEPLFEVKDDIKKPAAENIQITSTLPGFASAFNYDASSKKYIRSQGGRVGLDSSGITAPSTVVILETTPTVIDDALRVQVPLEEGGNAKIFTGGTVQKAIWSMHKGFVRLITEEGKPKALPGQVWMIFTEPGTSTHS